VSPSFYFSSLEEDPKTFLRRVFLSSSMGRHFYNLDIVVCIGESLRWMGGGTSRRKSPKKIQETRQSSHTPKDINPLLPTDCDTRLCIRHTHTQPSGMSRGHTRPKIYNEIRRWMCLFKSFKKNLDWRRHR
jgi:hypothetical protein